MRLARWVIVVHAGCLHSAAQICGDGSVCPPGQQCADTGSKKICILAMCGNGRRDPDEACDDGNTHSGDGCPADCSPPCGDGVLDPDEICDDGNTVDGDGCSSDCRSLDGIFLVSPSMVQLTATEGDPLPAGITVATRLELRADSVDGVPMASWLTVAKEPSTAGPVTFTLQVTDTSEVGLRSTSVRFATGDEAGTGRIFDLPVTYRVEPSELAVQATPAELAFTTTPGAAIPPPRTVNVMLTGATVSVLNAPAWLTVAALPGPPARPAFAVSVRSTAFPAATVLSDDIVFATTNASGMLRRTATVRVTYRLVARGPEVQFVSPYLGIAGQGGTLIVRGRDFRISNDPVTVGIGDLDIGPVGPDSDTQITLRYPPLPEGRYPVKTTNPPGVAPTGAELVVVTPPQFSYQAIDAPGIRRRILYDAERQAIYGLNANDDRIDHFAYANGSWSVLPPHTIPELRDVVMVPNGRSLIVVDPEAISEISLTDGSFALVKRADLPFTGIDRFFFSSAAAANNGKIFVALAESCCPNFFEETLLYDMQDHSLEGGGCFIANGGGAVASEDGSRIYISDDGIDAGNPVQIFDALSNTTHPSTASVEMRGASVSRDASRVILGAIAATHVYDRSLNLTGYIPTGVFLVSRDSSRAFVYVEGAEAARLDVYDLNGPLQSGAQYPLLKTVLLPDAASGDGFGVSMTSSLDDATVFISGSSKLLVVPVN